MKLLDKLFPSRTANQYPVSRTLMKRFYKAAENDRLVAGWGTNTVHIDAILRQQLRPLRARSRDQARNNDYAKRYIGIAENNVVGHLGVMVQAQVKQFRNPKKLDALANTALETAFKDWANSGCDLTGEQTFVDIQMLAIKSCIRDGEFLAIMHNTGEYGLQLEMMDAELLDVMKNEQTSDGGVIRLGIRYDADNVPQTYYFRKMDYMSGHYIDGQWREVPASRVLHLFRPEEVAQNRGIPWLATSLFRMKMLSGYEEAGITAARVGASKMGFFISPDGGGFTGDDTDADGNVISEAEAGSFEQLAQGTEFQSFDPTYPHEQFGDFIKTCLRGIASGMGISYHTLANDLEGVNYTSSRTGALEDREEWKKLQGWLISHFVRPVYEAWVVNAVLRGKVLIGNTPLAGSPTEYRAARYQGRRWDWVDPVKDTAADDMTITNKTASRSAVIRKRGDDPEEVFQEIADETESMGDKGISPNVETKTGGSDVEEDNQEQL